MYFNKSMKKITVVIVNWKSSDLAIACIESLKENASKYIDSIIVVDNDSKDDSLAKLKAISGLKIVALSENVGFGRACNIGARELKTDYVLFLNPDALVFFDTIKKTLEFMEREENRRIGICGVQLKDKWNSVARSCARFPTAFSFFCNSVGIDKFFKKMGFFMTDWSHTESSVVDHVIGAYFFVRSELFNRIGGFDKDYFMYFEDLDFSIRAKKAGSLSYFLSETSAYHEGGGTSNKIKAARLFYVMRSKIIYSHKHFSGFQYCISIFSILLLEPIFRSINSMARISFRELRENWLAQIMLFEWYWKWRS